MSIPQKKYFGFKISDILTPKYSFEIWICYLGHLEHPKRLSWVVSWSLETYWKIGSLKPSPHAQFLGCGSKKRFGVGDLLSTSTLYKKSGPYQAQTFMVKFWILMSSVRFGASFRGRGLKIGNKISITSAWTPPNPPSQRHQIFGYVLEKIDAVQ